MEQIRLVLAIISFVSQLLKWFDKAEESGLANKIDKLMKFKEALRSAEEGKADDLENMFTIMRPATIVSDRAEGEMDS